MKAKKLAKSKPKGTEINAFLAKVPPKQRAALQSLRKMIRAAAPKAVEAISYGVPTFKYEDHGLVSFGHGKEHLSFYVQSPAVMKAHARDLKGYDTSKGTVRFTAERPITAYLVRKLVKARIAENRKRFGSASK